MTRFSLSGRRRGRQGGDGFGGSIFPLLIVFIVMSFPSLS